MPKQTRFQSVMGVGKTTENDLRCMGYHYLEELKNVDPEQLFAQDEKRRGCKIDRCQLYVYRYLVYLSNHSLEDCKDLRWWHFKDEVQKED